jgi:hypothetical protein
MTGLIVSIKLRVEPAFRLREHKEAIGFDELVDPDAGSTGYRDDVDNAGDKELERSSQDGTEITGGRLDEIAKSAEHVRLWWYPQVRGVVIARANRTSDVSCAENRRATLLGAMLNSFSCVPVLARTATCRHQTTHRTLPHIPRHPVPALHLVVLARIHQVGREVDMAVCRKTVCTGR